MLSLKVEGKSIQDLLLALGLSAVAPHTDVLKSDPERCLEGAHPSSSARFTLFQILYLILGIMDEKKIIQEENEGDDMPPPPPPTQQEWGSIEIIDSI